MATRLLKVLAPMAGLAMFTVPQAQIYCIA
jgi:hypothetical protein